MTDEFKIPSTKKEVINPSTKMASEFLKRDYEELMLIELHNRITNPYVENYLVACLDKLGEEKFLDLCFPAAIPEEKKLISGKKIAKIIDSKHPFTKINRTLFEKNQVSEVVNNLIAYKADLMAFYQKWKGKIPPGPLDRLYLSFQGYMADISKMTLDTSFYLSKLWNPLCVRLFDYLHPKLKVLLEYADVMEGPRLGTEARTYHHIGILLSSWFRLFEYDKSDRKAWKNIRRRVVDCKSAYGK